MDDVLRLEDNWVHLGLGASAEPLDPFDGMAWYERYGKQVASDGAEGRLVSQYTFKESWDAWEMHPNGSEVVICVGGAIELIQALDGGERRVRLGAGDYAINPPGVWHTADIESECTAIFITAGMGTEHRER